MPVDYTAYPFSSPAPQIKALNVAPIPDRIFEGMKQYESAARGFDTFGFERDAHAAFVVHRPADAQVAQVYRMPLDAKEGDSLERLTHFDIGSGRTVLSFIPLVADSWRGVERRGGSLMVMDQNGDESFQLWRYWESGEGIPKRKGELDNKPGKGRIERLTWRDDCRYSQVYVSTSQKLLTYSSNKENKKDRLVYIARLDDTASASGDKFDIEAISVAAMPLPEKGTKGTAFWVTESISLNDRFLLVASAISSAHRPLYVVDLTGPLPAHPEKLVFPGATEAEDQTIYGPAVFSHDPTTPHLAYILTNAYGDFTSLVAYDLEARAVVQHITAPLPNLNALRPISWDIQGLRVSSELVLFRANVQGWNNLYAVPLKEGGRWRGHVVEIRLEWEGGVFEYITNRANGRPYEVLMKLTSYRSSGRLVHLDLDGAFEEGKCKLDEEGLPYIVAKPTECILANPEEPSVRAVKPELLKFKSFDELEVPSIYYHPNDRKTAVPLVIGIHGGPEGQATVRYKTAIHGYMLNELGCAVMYPNVRGSSGYGKRYMAADDIEKREDSVKDIGALLDHISTTMKNEIDSSKIAVMGGSYGGYMVYACLVHYSSKLTCGLANFGIAHWPSFLENTAPHRRDMRRKEYGDESDPETRKMLERISPLNRAAEMAVPLSIAHGETDSRVTVDEAMSLYGIVSGQVHTELMVCEKEGHGFKQKSVIEFTNAAKLRFLERFLFGQYDTKL